MCSVFFAATVSAAKQIIETLAKGKGSQLGPKARARVDWASQLDHVNLLEATSFLGNSEMKPLLPALRTELCL